MKKRTKQLNLLNIHLIFQRKTNVKYLNYRTPLKSQHTVYLNDIFVWLCLNYIIIMRVYMSYFDRFIVIVMHCRFGNDVELSCGDTHYLKAEIRRHSKEVRANSKDILKRKSLELLWNLDKQFHLQSQRKSKVHVEEQSQR